MVEATIHGIAEDPSEIALVTTRDPRQCDPVRPSFQEVDDSAVVSGRFRSHLESSYLTEGRWTFCAVVRDGEDAPRLRAVARTTVLVG